jgi:hypothetical protein
MIALVLDAGALIAIDRGDRVVHEKIEKALRIGQPVRTNPNAVAQVWRDGAKQARLVRVLRDVKIEPITLEDGYRAGELLGGARTRMSSTPPWPCSRSPATGCTPATQVTSSCSARPQASRPW